MGSLSFFLATQSLEVKQPQNRANKRRSTIPVVARSKGGPNEVLTKEQLQKIRHKLAEMSGTAIQDFYRSAHYRAQRHQDRLPPPRAIQELVQAWKQLRRWFR